MNINSLTLLKNPSWDSRSYREVFPYSVVVSPNEISDEDDQIFTSSFNWCRENLGYNRFIRDYDTVPDMDEDGLQDILYRLYPDGRWDFYGYRYFFKTEDDALLFKLTWAGE